MRAGLLPAHLVLEDGLLPDDFPVRLGAFKDASGLSWEALAACMGVDPRQVHRWRKGAKPSGDGLWALIQLAARVPGGFGAILGGGIGR